MKGDSTNLNSARLAGDSTIDSLRISCPHCSESFVGGIESDLSKLTCPKCGRQFSLIPDAGEQTTATYSLENKKIGHFELIDELGRGGFGSVWMARDKRLQRTVAIKIPHLHRMHGNRIEWFFREARAAAQIQHPNIVSVFEIGREGNLIYIVSEFIRGTTLTNWMTGKSPSPRDAAEMCRSLAEALQHAHQSGIVHRDLKPGNVLIDAEGVPKITDFGLAKRDSDDSTLTVAGKILGTPAYMSPEQAMGLAHHVTGQADIFSLGVMLFELLTSARPFRGNSQMIIHQVIHSEAPPVRQFNSAVPVDLEAICMRCLEKEQEKRYATANDLADDLTRFLNGRHVTARRVTKLNRCWRWCKRNRTVASLSALLVIVLAVGLISTTKYWRDAETATSNALTALNDAKQSRKELRRNLFTVHMDVVRDALQQGDIPNAVHVLERYIPTREEEEEEEEEEDLRDFVWHLWWGQCQRHSHIFDHGSSVKAIEFFPAGTKIATAGTDGWIRIWDLNKRITVRELSNGRINRGCSLSVSSNGRWLAATADSDHVRIWDLTQESDPILLQGGAVEVAFDADAQHLICVNRDGTPRRFDTNDWLIKDQTNAPKMAPVAAVIAPDHRVACVANRRGSIFLRGIDTDHIDEFKSNALETVWSLALSPDGQTIAAGYVDDIRLLDVKSGENRAILKEHKGPIGSLAFSNDGTRLLSACNDGTVKLWDLDSQEVLDSHFEHVNFVTNGLARYSRDGRRLACASSDGTVKVRFCSDELPRRWLTGHKGRVESVTFTPDSRYLITAGSDARIHVWDAQNGNLSHTLNGHQDTLFDVSVSPDGSRLATASNDRNAILWDRESSKLLHKLSAHTSSVFCVAFSPDGETLATGGVDRLIHLWSVATGQLLGTLNGHDGGVRDVLFIDSKRIASASVDGTVRIWSVNDHTEIAKLTNHDQGVRCLSLSADKKLLASGSEDRTVKLWSTTDYSIVQSIPGLGGIVNAVSFCADGTTLATGGQDRILRLWDLRTGEVKSYLDFRSRSKQILSLAFSPDGMMLASGNLDQSVRLFRAQTGYASAQSIENSAAFNRDIDEVE